MAVERGQLIVRETLTFVVKSGPEEGSCLGAGEVNRHVSLASTHWHDSVFVGVNINGRVVTAVSDLVENSRLQGLVGVVVTDLGCVVVAVERRILAREGAFGGFLAFSQ